MQTIDIARRCAELNAVSDANNAYILAIQELPVTLALALINLGYPALFLMIPEALLSGYLFCLLFFFFATSACLSAGLLLHTLKKSQA